LRERRLWVQPLEERLLLAGESLTDAILMSPTGTVQGSLASAGDAAFFQLTLSQPGLLVARLHAQTPNPFLGQLRLVAANGQVLVQSDGISPSNPDCLIAQHLDASTCFLEVQSLHASGAFTLSTDFQLAPAPFQPIALGTNARLVTGDYNDDGKMDLAAITQVDANDSLVSLLLGRGDGSFAAQSESAVSGAVTAFLAGDFNNNGCTDLILGTSNSSTQPSTSQLQVLLGQPDGSFVKGEPLSLPGAATRLLTGDFNNDSIPDLVALVQNNDTTNGNTTSTLLLVGQGDGSFVLNPENPLPDGLTPFLAGDFDGDDRADLVAASTGFLPILGQTTGSVQLYKGAGDGSFALTEELFLQAGVANVLTGDFNGDGTPDLAAVTFSYRQDGGPPTTSSVSVFLGQRAGSFAPAVQAFSLDFPTNLLAADFNGDGKTDLVTTSYDGSSVAVFLSQGNGSFTEAAPSALPGRVKDLVAADLNGDHRQDLVVVPLLSSGNVATKDSAEVLLGRGDGTFEVPTAAALDSTVTGLVAGDFNGDGLTDFAAGTSFSTASSVSSALVLLEGQGGGSFTAATGAPVLSGVTPLLAGDFDQDGHTDLIVHSDDGQTRVLLGKGDGTFTNAGSLPMPGNLGTPTAVTEGDFNGDGIPDLAFSADEAHDSGTPVFASDVFLLLGAGDGTFRIAGGESVLGSVTSLVADDFNGDGNLDLAALTTVTDPSIPSTTTEIAVLQGHGDGFLNVVATIPVLNAIAPLLVGDFNGDGLPDLAIRTRTVDSAMDSTVNAVQFLLGQADGSFVPGNPLSLPAGVTAVLAGDFNGDGRTDLAVGVQSADASTSAITSSVELFTSQQDGSFAISTPISLPFGWRPLLAGDFNGDGRTDIAGATTLDQGGLSIYLGQGDGTFVNAQAVPRGTAPTLADLNGDGTPDALSVDKRGNILFRAGLPGAPGQFAASTDVNFLGDPARDATVVATPAGERIAALSATQNQLVLYTPAEIQLVPVLGPFFRTPALSAPGGQQAAGSTASLNPPLLQTFEVTATLPTGSLPERVAAVDLNGDGLQDLVALNAGDGSLSIFFQSAAGAFDSGVLIPVGVGISDFFFADINKDGHTDILLTNQLSGETTILSNNGDGTFKSLGSFATGSGPYSIAASTQGGAATSSPEDAQALAVGDFNRDGIPDIAVLNGGSNTIGILLGRSGGGFYNPQVISLGNDPADIVSGDFNRDGIPDLAVLENGSVAIYQGDGSGGFALSSTATVSSSATGLMLEPNNSGSSDLVVGDASGGVEVLQDKPDGTFAPYLPAPPVTTTVTQPTTTPSAGSSTGSGSSGTMATSTAAVLTEPGGEGDRTLLSLAVGSGGDRAITGADVRPDASAFSLSEKLPLLYLTESAGFSDGMPRHFRQGLTNAELINYVTAVEDAFPSTPPLAYDPNGPFAAPAERVPGESESPQDVSRAPTETSERGNSSRNVRSPIPDYHWAELATAQPATSAFPLPHFPLSFDDAPYDESFRSIGAPSPGAPAVASPERAAPEPSGFDGSRSWYVTAAAVAFLALGFFSRRVLHWSQRSPDDEPENRLPRVANIL
jgi:hypothetical protein